MISCNKNIIITGASRGLGKAIADCLAKSGCNLAICSSNKKRINQVASQIKKNGDLCKSYCIDIRKEDGVNCFINNYIRDFKSVDVLINNAAWATVKTPIEDTTTTIFKKYMQTNFDSIFYLLKRVIPLMKKRRKGMIVNIASQSGILAQPGLAIYSASKSAVISITQAASRELERFGITSVAICPAGINTDMRRKICGTEDAQKQQSPESVAAIIKKIVLEQIVVSNGGNVHIQNGKIVKIDDPYSYIRSSIKYK